LTFNYDIGLDMAFSQQGIRSDYFLGENTVGGNETKLLKLHGSINWGRRKGGGAIVPCPMEVLLSGFHPEFLEPDRTFVTLQVGTNIASLMKQVREDVEETPVIVPPGLFKNEYQGSISRVWQQAAKELEEAEEIIVIGYSLPDTDFFFRNLFALGTVGRKFIRRFAVVNPDKSIEQRFRSLLGPGTKDRFNYRECNFADVITEMRGWYAVPPVPAPISISNVASTSSPIESPVQVRKRR